MERNAEYRHLYHAEMDERDGVRVTVVLERWEADIAGAEVRYVLDVRATIDGDLLTDENGDPLSRLEVLDYGPEEEYRAIHRAVDIFRYAGEMVDVELRMRHPERQEDDIPF